MSLHIVLNSDDDNSVGNSSNFTTTLANEVILNAFNSWEVAVLAVSYPTANPYTNKAIYVESDIADFSYVGGNKKKIIFKTTQNQTTPLESEMTHIIPQTPNWIKMSKTKFSDINIKIVDSEDVYVPITQPSSVTLSIRRVI